MESVSKTFRGECPKCNKIAIHEEYSRERRSIGSAQAAARGDFKTLHEFSFRCTACGQRNEKVMDDQGMLHKWQGNKHIAMRF